MAIKPKVKPNFVDQTVRHDDLAGRRQHISDMEKKLYTFEEGAMRQRRARDAAEEDSFHRAVGPSKQNASACCPCIRVVWVAHVPFFNIYIMLYIKSFKRRNYSEYFRWARYLRQMCATSSSVGCVSKCCCRCWPFWVPSLKRVYSYCKAFEWVSTWMWQVRAARVFLLVCLLV